MVMRGSPSRRLVGNPLGGVLQDVHRKARRPTRTAGRPAEVPPGDPLPDPPVSVHRREQRGALAAVVETDAEGRADWRFPEELLAEPVLTALPTGSAVVVPVVEEVTVAGAVVRLWSLDGSPVPAGVAVHLTASAPS